MKIFYELFAQPSYVLVTYRDEENQMKNEGARVVTTLYSYILDAQGQLTLLLVDWCGGKSNSFKLLWKSLLTTNEKDPFKNEGARVVTTDLPL